MEPVDYGLSQNLTDRLCAWYDTWDAENLYERGWGSPDKEMAWKVDGDSIAEQLRAEVKDFADLECDEWKAHRQTTP